MEWSVSVVNGGKVLSFPHSQNVPGVFSEDGKYFIAILSHQIRVYFVGTRQCTRSVDIDMSDCVDVRLDPSSSNAIMAYNRNEIWKINWKEKLADAVISREEVAEVITSVIYQYADGGLLYISGEDDVSVLYKSPEGKITRVYKTTNVIKSAVSFNCEYLAILNENKEVISINLGGFLDVPPTEDVENLDVIIKNFNYKSPIVSIAVNNDNIIALGSLSGPIQIIFNDDNDNEKILKWHIGPVKALQFHENFLVSGGDEKVLVIWQIDSDKTQFLPRLNGVIEKISIDQNKPDHYNLALSINGQYELLVLSAVDLISRLTINSVRPNLKRKSNFKNSSSLVAVHPKTNQLFLPNNSTIQAFDLIKSEQVFHQTVSSVVPMGKVKSELKLTDPVVSQLVFSEDGEYMCTFDIIKSNEIDNLLSQNDTNYALKFWKAPASNSTADSGWTLVTKIINPHLSNAVQSIISYQGGFLTADSRGNLRLWKLKNKTWSVVKTFESLRPESRNVDLTKSDDNSIIIMSHENVVLLINLNFNLVKSLSLVETNIRSIEVVGHDLIILSKTKLVSFDLVNFKYNDLVATVNVSQGKSYLSANNNLVAVALNFQDSRKSKFFIFNTKSLSPVFSRVIDTYVNSVVPYNDGFLYIDNELRVGVVSNNELKLNGNNDSIEDGITTVTNTNRVGINGDSENFSFKSFDLNSFNNIFETDNLENLFDNIIKIVK